MSNQPLSSYAQCARMNRKGIIETMKEQKSMIRTLTGRSFKKNKSRNLVAVLAITMTAMMFTTLFTLAQSLSKNLTEMYLRQTGTKAHTTTKQITRMSNPAAAPSSLAWRKMNGSAVGR